MKKSNPFISVIINCFNGEKYLHHTLNSVLNQSFKDWELIFWDNRSNDRSSEIFNGYKDERFKYYLAPQHLNLAAAKELAIERAKGEWLALLDADDLWLENKLSMQVKLINEGGQNLGLVYGRMELIVEAEAINSPMAKRALINQNYGKQKKLPEGDVFNSLVLENYMPQPSLVIKKDVYFSVGGVDTSLRHAWDYDLTLRIANCYTVRALQDICCYYRIHGANLSQTQGDLCCQESIHVLQKFLPSASASQGIKNFLATWVIRDITRGLYLEGWQRAVEYKIYFELIKKFLTFTQKYIILYIDKYTYKFINYKFVKKFLL